jgi:hypothetical protein
MPEIIIPDGGPLYAETNLEHLVAEPWNAISSLTFLIPVIYWLWRLRGNYKDYKFLLFCMPFLVLGGLGSTLFHAFRASEWLLFMDFMPIIVLTLCISIYFWVLVLPKRWMVAAVILISLALRGFAFSYFGRSDTFINISYIISGTMMLLPAVLLLRKTNFYLWHMPLLAVLFFITALGFRYADLLVKDLIPVGTHWLWHVSCAIGIMPLSYYLVKIARLDLLNKAKQESVSLSEAKG